MGRRLSGYTADEDTAPFRVLSFKAAGAIHATSQPATGIGEGSGTLLYYEDEV